MRTYKIWLMGGFGNVLFQILAYRMLKKKQESVKFVDFLTKKNIVTKTIKWSIHQDLYHNLITDAEFFKPSVLSVIPTIFFSLLSKKTNLSFGFVKFYKGSLDTDKAITENVFGYFQEKDFLKRNAFEIITLGEQLNSLYTKEKKYSVVIHFRGGDSYSEEHKIYYEKIKALIINDGSLITIVTDNFDLAKDFFKEFHGSVEIVKSENAMDDFAIMVSCKILYCAPSTFSWWAAHSIDHNAKVFLSANTYDLLGFYNGNCDYEII